MFRLVSLNLNGIRSAANKGVVQWVESLGCDCMGVQEIRAQWPEVEGRFDAIGGMQGHFHFAERRGYSGVGIYARTTPTEVVTGFGSAEFDAEGRYVELRFDTPLRKLSIISCYFPSGSSSEERQLAKYRFLELFYPHMVALKAEREFILVGDINIAHQEIDLKNWKGNRKNSGFLPDERAWMTRCLDPLHDLCLVDVFRSLNKSPDQYTWWSNRGQARTKNVGWRIDYHLATPAVASLARKERIHLEPRFSDHAPVIVDYDLTL